MKRFCRTCGIQLSKNCKGDLCNHHRDRTGKNNSFYGKTHNPEMIQRTKEKLKVISEQKWQETAYREKVIKAVSKPRIHSFKLEQSQRVTQWYKDNPEQRKIRSRKMSDSWKTGALSISTHLSFNASKIEKQFFEALKSISPDLVIKKTLFLEDGSRVVPDVFIPRLNLIFEFYGTFWHADPDVYGPEDIIHHNILAEEIWKRDEKRKLKILMAGYSIEIIWENQYKHHKETVLKNIEDYINWDSCSF
jgi:G:T-mismatch repair DNA endonuclease (very short patch repair protein)